MTMAPVMRKTSRAVVLVVAVVAGCSRSTSNRQAPEPPPAPAPTRVQARESPSPVATSDEAHAALGSLEAEFRARGSRMAVVTEETVERHGQSLTQYRITAPSGTLPPGIDSPTLVWYTPIGDRAGSPAAADAIVDALRNAADLIPGLMRQGQIAIAPVVAYFAVKPSRKVRAWVSGLVQPLLIHDRDLLIHDLGAVEVPEIQRTIVIGIVFPAAGQRVNAFDLPMPPDWMAAKAQAGSKLLVFPEDLFAIIWPD
jgi:hypothetical protein